MVIIKGNTHINKKKKTMSIILENHLDHNVFHEKKERWVEKLTILNN